MAAAAILLVVATLLVIWSRSRRRVALRSTSDASKASAQVQSEPPPVESFAAALKRLSDTVASLAEKSAHPHELTDWPEFQAVVDAFSRRDASFATLRQYALGGGSIGMVETRAGLPGDARASAEVYVAV